MKETTPYKDKNLKHTEIKGKDIDYVEVTTHRSFEQCTIVDLHIHLIGGKVQRYNYWKHYDKSKLLKDKGLT